MMAKFRLSVEDEFDFELIGICADHSDYRLCWAINQALRIQLERKDDYEIVHGKDGSQLFSMYAFSDPADKTEYYLIRNLSGTQKRLIPEKSQIDYFLILKNNALRELSEINGLIRAVGGVRTSVMIEPGELKSKSNLLF